MKQLFAWSALLLISSARAGGFYLEGGVSAIYSTAPIERLSIVGTYTYDDQGRTILTSYHDVYVSLYPYDIPRIKNPYLLPAIGYDWDWRRWSLDAKLYHRSSLYPGDHGESGGSISVRYYPFGRR